MNKERALLASCGDDVVRLWTDDGTLVSSFDVRSSSDNLSGSKIVLLRWFPTGKVLAVATSTGAISFHRCNDLSFIRYLRPPQHSNAAVTALDISSGSRFLAVGYNDGALVVWDMKTRDIETSFRDEGPVASVAFQRTSDSRYVACAHLSTVSLYSRASNRLVNRFEITHKSETQASGTESSSSTLRAKFTAIGFSPKRVNLLVAADDIGSVVVWDITQSKPATTSVSFGHKGDRQCYAYFTTTEQLPASDIVFLSNVGGLSLGVAYLDKYLRFFDLDARQLVYKIPCPAPLTALAFAADASLLSCGTSDGSILSFRIQHSDSSYSHTLENVTTDAHKAEKTPERAVSCAAVRSLDFQPNELSKTSPRKIDDGAAMISSGQLAIESQGAPPRASLLHSSSDSSTPMRTGGVPYSLKSGEPASDSHKGFQPSHVVTEVGIPDQLTHEQDLFSPVPAKSRRHGEFSAVSKLTDPLEELTHEQSYSSSGLVLPLTRTNNPRKGRDSDIIPSGTGTSHSGLDEAHHTPVSPVHESFGNPEQTPGGLTKYHSMSGIAPHNSQISEMTAQKSVDWSALEKTVAASASENESPSEPIPGRQGVFSHEGNGAPTPVALKRPGQGKANRSSSELYKRQNSGLPPLPPRSRSEETISTKQKDACQPVSLSEYSTEIELSALQTSTKMNEDEDISNIALSAEDFDPTVAGQPSFGDESVVGKSDVRQMIEEQIDILRADLRSDILNLHRELVLCFERQEEEFQKLILTRDSRVTELERKVSSLRSENQRLRGLQSKGFPTK